LNDTVSSSGYDSRAPIYYLGLLIFESLKSYSFRHTILGRTPLFEWSVCRRVFYVTKQHSQDTDIHAPGEIRTRNPKKREAVDSCLKTRGHRVRYLRL